MIRESGMLDDILTRLPDDREPSEIPFSARSCRAETPAEIHKRLGQTVSDTNHEIQMNTLHFICRLLGELKAGQDAIDQRLNMLEERIKRNEARKDIS